MPHLVLLPGLDGTGELFEDFVAATPTDYSTAIEPYPSDTVCRYEELRKRIQDRLPRHPFWLLAESYAGPLAASIAAEQPQGLQGLIFAVSFVRSPRPFWLRTIPWTMLRPFSISDLAFRWSMAGFRAPRSQIQKLQDLRQKVGSEVLGARLAELASVDATHELERCPVPILYLRARHDRLVLRSSSRLMKRIRPDMTVVTLDAPHLLLQTVPVQAWEAIASFVESSRPG